MVKITFQPVSVQKPEKEADEDKIIVPQAHVSLHRLCFNVNIVFTASMRCLSEMFEYIQLLHKLNFMHVFL